LPSPRYDVMAGYASPAPTGWPRSVAPEIAAMLARTQDNMTFRMEHESC
jgi:hypothetical protein